LSRILANLWQLQQADVEIERLRSQLKTLESGAALRSQLEKWKQEGETLRIKREAARTELKDGELKLGSLEEKKAAVEKQLYGGQTTNPREVVDLQRELASLAEVRDRLETKVLGLLDLGEELQAQFAQKGQGIEQGEQELSRVEAEFASETERLQTRLAALEEERAKSAESIEKSTLERYVRIKQSAGGKGASLVARGACSECHMAVPNYVLMEIIEGGAVVTCEHCGRLLCMLEGGQ
jgi:hypothetical protein